MPQVPSNERTVSAFANSNETERVCNPISQKGLLAIQLRYSPQNMRLSESLGADVRMAIRVLRKSPGTTALCVLSIALGIGLTTGIFSVGDAIMLRPFALERPSEVFEVTSRADDGQPVFYAWQDYGNMARAAQGVADL